MLRTLSKTRAQALTGKRVLLRVDFNVPIDKRGVTDDTRIRETLPTIKYLLERKARVIIITHLGRPEGRVVDGLKLTAVARALEKLLKKKVTKLNAAIGPQVETALNDMKNGGVILLENIRFYKQEETNDPGFVKQLARLGDVYVNDAFAACHRKHASVYGIAKLLPSYAGFLVEQEIKHLTPLLRQPKHPLTLIIGGAKIDTKIGLIKKFLGKADHILVGGALANTFFAAQGFDVGRSLYEPEKIEIAQEILMLAEKKGQSLLLPQDVIVADVATNFAKTLDLAIESVEGDMKILDIGTKTQAHYAAIIKESKTVVWNGPMGLYEFTPFSSGTRSVAKNISKNRGTTFLGGGDTLDALARLKIPRSKFSFVSTGGGAMLEFLGGEKLPGIEILMH